MARGRRNTEVDGIIAFGKLVVFLALIVPFFPKFQDQFLNKNLLIGVGVLLIGVFLVFLILMKVKAHPQSASRNTGMDQPSMSHSGNLKTFSPQLILNTTSNHTSENLIKELRGIDWFQFEKLVAQVYKNMGYAVTRRGGGNPDGGIDLIIEKEGVRSAVQCKQWKTWNVGVKVVREFLGALTDAGISKGVLMTLCGYTEEAKQLALRHGIEMVNEDGLARWIEETQVRFDPEIQKILSDTEKFCPKCESKMVLRTAKKGAHVGNRFWGCSDYPKCRFIIQDPALQ